MPDRTDRSKPRSLRPMAATALAFVMLAPAPCQRARADELDLGLFLPPLGRAATFRVASPAPEPHGTFRLGLVLDYGRELLERSAVCDASNRASWFCSRELRTRALVADLVRADVLASIALYEVFEIGLGVPLVLTRAAPNPASRLETHFGVADLRVGVGATLAAHGPTRVAVRVDTTWPTATERSLSGSGNWSITPSLVLTQDLRRITLAARLGYHVRQRVLVYDLEQDDEIVFHMGAAYAATRQLSVITDASARIGVGGLRLSMREVAVEVDVGARLRGPGTSSFEFALGTNALPVDGGGFAPELRALLGVRGVFAPSAREPVPASTVVDSDGDGFPDDEDACAFDAEDRDGFADDDGCPDLDNDADGIADEHDACPERSEDSDGFQDQDGCPEVDNDEDGVADGADRCRMAPEDRDGFEDFDGCPEPGPARPVVTLSGSRSLVADTIYFDGQADTLGAASQPLLDELARTLQRLPQHKRVRVEGHTDNVGVPEHNIDLSYRRAKAVVEYLKARGVPALRLEHAGYGGQRPLADNRTPEGRALNRRVQFSLIDAPP